MASFKNPENKDQKLSKTPSSFSFENKANPTQALGQNPGNTSAPG